MKNIIIDTPNRESAEDNGPLFLIKLLEEWLWDIVEGQWQGEGYNLHDTGRRIS